MYSEVLDAKIRERKCLMRRCRLILMDRCRRVYRELLDGWLK